MGEERFDPAALTKAAEDTLTVRRVFGEAYERDGVLVIPVARVTGMTGLGSGGGEGGGGPARVRKRRQVVDDEVAPDDASAPATAHGTGYGGGGGWGLHVKPLGVYVVDATGVQWRATYDVGRIVLGAELVTAWGLAIGFAAWAVTRRR